MIILLESLANVREAQVHVSGSKFKVKISQMIDIYTIPDATDIIISAHHK